MVGLVCCTRVGCDVTTGEGFVEGTNVNSMGCLVAGIVEGFTLGPPVTGASLGTVEGHTLGAIGWPVGSTVGRVGSAVGIIVGPVGAVVGVWVGCVGAVLGANVGDSDGRMVGSKDGMAVGDAVGKPSYVVNETTNPPPLLKP